MIKAKEEKFIKDIIELVEIYKDDISEGYKKIQKQAIKDVDDILKVLIELFAEEEKRIAIEHSRNYVTDIYENGVRRFAKSLINHLISYHADLQENEKYKVLCRQKHIAYGYYSIRNTGFYEKMETVDASYRKVFYLGLVDFYGNFYGSFTDNEEAIELLCKFYPKEVDLREYEDRIALALYMHISNAGTPSDFGYAYRGIDMIKTHICNLPESLIHMLLKKFALYYIINSKIHRHQLFTIIDFSQFTPDMKRVLKFRYLDSLLIANALNQFLIKALRERGEEVDVHNNYYDYNLSDDKLIVFDTPFVYWGNDDYKARVLYKNEQPYIKIEQHQKEIKVVDVETKAQIVLQYEYSDWMLEDYRFEKSKELQKLVSRKEGVKWNEPMLFSLAYLKNYRGVEKCCIDFDHRFSYEEQKNLLFQHSESKTEIPHIYGKSVYSLSCIVGRNAAGKTSIMDFLRETFFKLLKFVEEKKLACENGYVDESEYMEYGLLDEKVQFLVAFSIGKQTYFLTNMRGVQVNGLTPFQTGAYSSINELSKVAYFSSQLRGDFSRLLLDAEEDHIYDTEKREKQNISKLHNDFRQVDYSETASFIRKRNALSVLKVQDESLGVVNKDLCYQLSLLKKVDAQQFYKELEIKDNKKFLLTSGLDGKKEVVFTLKEAKNDSFIKEIAKNFIKMPDAQLQYFSAGQYAKFTFWAKLRWFLEGADEIRNANELAGEMVFSSDEVLLNGETALIFIDEGEIYYHPEWQRCYIKKILNMVNEKPRKVQIIVTTNSPFMISDILSEDITYLSDKKMEDGEETLGQNIHKLLRENFFMDYTIGEYARTLIENIMLCLTQKNDELNRLDVDEILEQYYDQTDDYYEAFQNLINQVGEPIYKYNLEKLLEESSYAVGRNIDQQIMELEAEKIRLQEKIEGLKEKKRSDSFR